MKMTNEATVIDREEKTLQLVEAKTRQFELAQREAKLLASSQLIPKHYRDNVADVVVAMNMAKRMHADPLMVMQSLHIIHGKPGWSAQFLIATFNSCGRFAAIQYEFSDDRSECTAVTTELATGREIKGPSVTLEMAKKEGWSTKQGSKWQTMPELMLRYRAATFLIRTTAPEIGLGLYTQDEILDMRENALPQQVMHQNEANEPEESHDIEINFDAVELDLREAVYSDVERNDGETTDVRAVGSSYYKEAASEEDKRRISDLVELCKAEVAKKTARGDKTNDRKGQA